MLDFLLAELVFSFFLGFLPAEPVFLNYIYKYRKLNMIIITFCFNAEPKESFPSGWALLFLLLDLSILFIFINKINLL